jgi:hypothetical protein
MAQSVAARWQEVPFASILAIEHSARETVQGSELRTYGDTAITLLRAGDER